MLTWDEKPTDLDLHTYLGPYLHTYWGSMRNADYSTGLEATLDRDAVWGKGPETVTLKGIKKCTGSASQCLIKFRVHNWSRDRQLGQANGVMTIYVGSTVRATMYIPETAGDAVWFDIFTIDASTGQIFQGDKKVEPSLYADRSGGEDWRTSFDNEIGV